MSSAPRWRSLLGLAALVGAALLANAWWQGTRAERLGAQVAQTARPGDIAMISSETCVFCERARAWFQAHEIPFTECFVERDPACAAAYAAWLAPGTPVLLIRGQRQLGFDAQRVADALD